MNNSFDLQTKDQKFFLSSKGPSPIWSDLKFVHSPSARWGHSMNLFSKNIIIFGGFSKQYLSDLWVFDIYFLKWSNINLSNSPEPRSHHSAVSLSLKFANFEKNQSSQLKITNNHHKYMEKMILFGGKGKNNKAFSDVWELDWSNKKWKTIVNNENNNVSPCSRFGHSANLLFDKFMILFGGENVIDLFDLWALDLQTYLWKQIKTIGKSPSPRKFHSSVIFQENLVIIGGCFENYKSLK